MPDTTSQASEKHYTRLSPHEKVIVLLSGGQDSTTCLLLAIDRVGTNNVYPLCFRYGQRHSVEVDQARKICAYLNVRPPSELTAEALATLGGASITDPNVQVNSDDNVYAQKHNLPSSVVPGRNMLFLTLAAAYGAKFGVYNLLTGGCLADYDGYPDCRPAFYHMAERALQLALDEEDLRIVTPLVHVTKGETFAIAKALGELILITQMTHTCYNGHRGTQFAFGAGCGNCNACITRKEGWEEFQHRFIIGDETEMARVVHNINHGNYFL